MKMNSSKLRDVGGVNHMRIEEKKLISSNLVNSFATWDINLQIRPPGIVFETQVNFSILWIAIHEFIELSLSCNSLAQNMNVHFLKHFPFKSFTLCVSYSRKTDFLMSTKNQLTQVVTTTTTATTCPELPVDFQVPLSILPITHRANAHRSVVREKSQTSDQHFFSRSKSSQEKKSYVSFPKHKKYFD